MKQNKETTRKISLKAQILAGILALLMLSGTVFGLLMYIL